MGFLLSVSRVFTCLFLLCYFGFLNANPTGGTVVDGTVNINVVNSQLTQIVQSSDRAIINWNDFSIGKGETTQFIQSSSSAAVLNRVTGGNISEIYGNLTANGQLFLINPNGVTIGASGVINAAAFTASTLNVGNDSFMYGNEIGNNLLFSGEGAGGEIHNLGKISVTNGDVILIAKKVINEGKISAPNGMIGVAEGFSELLLKESGSSRVYIRVQELMPPEECEECQEYDPEAMMMYGDEELSIGRDLEIPKGELTNYDSENLELIVNEGPTENVSLSNSISLNENLEMILDPETGDPWLWESVGRSYGTDWTVLASDSASIGKKETTGTKLEVKSEETKPSTSPVDRVAKLVKESGGNIYSLAINNGGIERASEASVGEDGVVEFGANKVKEPSDNKSATSQAVPKGSSQSGTDTSEDDQIMSPGETVGLGPVSNTPPPASLNAATTPVVRNQLGNTNSTASNSPPPPIDNGPPAPPAPRATDDHSMPAGGLMSIGNIGGINTTPPPVPPALNSAMTPAIQSGLQAIL